MEERLFRGHGTIWTHAKFRLTSPLLLGSVQNEKPQRREADLMSQPGLFELMPGETRAVFSPQLFHMETVTVLPSG